MAGAFSRFPLATDSEIQRLKNSTRFWLSVWKKWCVEKEIEKDIPPAELNILLERLYAEVKNELSEDYEPDSLKVMLTLLNPLIFSCALTFL